MKESELPEVRIYNPSGSEWPETKCLIDGKEVKNVRLVNFHGLVDGIPISESEIMGIPDIKMCGDIRFRFIPKTVTDAVFVLRHELLAHGEVYNGFKASLKTAIEKYCTCGLPFEPEEQTAGKILDFMIGEEQTE